MQHRKCIYCRGRKLSPAHVRSDGKTVVRCVDCGLMFLRDWPDDITSLYRDDYFDQMPPANGQGPSGEWHIPEVGYGTYAEIGPLEFRWQQALLRLFAGRPGVQLDGEAPAPRLLDVGCANGSFLVLARTDGYQTEGVELLDVAASQARARGLRVHSQPFERVGKPGQYDVVTAWEFIEHVADLRAVLSQVRSLLGEGGVFLFSTPDAGAATVEAQGDRWIGYRSSLEHLTYLTGPFLLSAITEIFGTAPLLFPMLYQSLGETYSTMIGMVRVGGLRASDEEIGKLIAKRSLPRAAARRREIGGELAWLYAQFCALEEAQLAGLRADLSPEDEAGLRGWLARLRFDLKTSVPLLTRAAKIRSELWQAVAVDGARLHQQDLEDQLAAGRAREQSLQSEVAQLKAHVSVAQQQIAYQQQTLQHHADQWHTTLNSMTWKIGRGITSRIERIPLSHELLTAAQVLRSDGLDGLVGRALQTARTRVEQRLPSGPRLQRFAPTLWDRIHSAPGTFILLRSVPWQLTLFQRPQHIARALAQLGYVVIYDESGLLAEPAADPVREIEPNLFVWNAGDDAMLAEIPRPILWAFTYNYALRDAFGPDALVLYDWIDDLKVFPHDQKFLADAHARGMREADVVASVARVLHEQAVTERADALYLPNGVDFDHFSAPDLLPPDDETFAAIRAAGKPIAGYYGAVASWFDYDGLMAVATQRPDWNFVLIGVRFDDSLDKTKLLQCPNVYFLGPRPYQTLPRYLRCFDVAMIPFVINDITLATSPLKLYEYFAGGRAVITSPMPECVAYEDVLIARTPTEFAGHLDTARARTHDPEFQARLHAVAKDNTWLARARTAADRVRAVGNEKPVPIQPVVPASAAEVRRQRFYRGLHTGINAVDQGRSRLRRLLGRSSADPASTTH